MLIKLSKADEKKAKGLADKFRMRELRRATVVDDAQPPYLVGERSDGRMRVLFTCKDLPSAHAILAAAIELSKS